MANGVMAEATTITEAATALTVRMAAAPSLLPRAGQHRAAAVGDRCTGDTPGAAPALA